VRQTETAALAVSTIDAQAMLNSLPAYVTVQDLEYRIINANDACRRDFGEAVGQPCYRIFKSENEVCPECRLAQTLATGESCTWEETLRTIHEQTVHTVVHTAPMRGANGQIVGALKVCSDISEFKRLSRQLELSQQEFKALFQGAPCHISIQDQDFNIIRTNRLFEKDFGRGFGRRCYQVYKARDSKCEPCPVEKTFEDGQIHSSEETVRRSGGELMDMIVYTSPIRDLTGRVFAVMEMSTNITEVKRLQRELATLGQAVSVTAHAIKNILNGLQGGAYVVRSGLKRGDQALAQKGWEMIQEGVELVSQFVKDILLISKARAPEHRDTVPSDPARQVWTLFEKRARDLGVELVLEVDERLSQTISLDPKGIHTVLSNLVSNALDACLTDGGKTERRIVIRVKDLQRDGLLYEVEDNAGGIPTSVQEKLFQELISTKGSRGTGLGLVVSGKIVREHGGAISFHSTPGQGTVFRVSLPRAGEHGPPGPRTPRGSSSTLHAVEA
jgi:PAS domain S-box-containing protein